LKSSILFSTIVGLIAIRAGARGARRGPTSDHGRSQSRVNPGEPSFCLVRHARPRARIRDKRILGSLGYTPIDFIRIFNQLNSMPTPSFAAPFFD
jgi:hypothetical protein